MAPSRSLPLPPGQTQIITPEAARINRISHVKERREAIKKTGEYLGNPSAADAFIWKQVGRSRVLVHKDKSSDDGGQFVIFFYLGLWLISIRIGVVQPAELSAIGHISSEGIFLNTNWEGPTEYLASIDQMRIGCKFGRPVTYGAEVQGDYDYVIANLAALEAKAAVPGTTSVTSIVSPSTTVIGEQLVKIRHILFSVVCSRHHILTLTV
jgi:hypothetical protein